MPHTKLLTRDRTVTLPAPAHDGRMALERAMLLRRSQRSFAPRALELAQLTQLLWAAQGLTDLEGRRTTPSAGAAYPLEVHALVGAVTGVACGHYRDLPRRQLLLELAPGDRRAHLAHAAHDQQWAATAPLLLVLTGIDERTTFAYGERGRRHMELEAGCAAQNVLLQATALGLASVLLAAFEAHDVSRLLGLPEWEQPLLVLALGWPAMKRGT